MSRRDSELVRRAVVEAAARPGPWLVGLLAAWLVSGVAGPVAALLGGTTGFLGWLVVGLLSGEAPALPEPARPALPAPPPPAEGGAPLPEGLRDRYQALHRSVSQMREHWPRDVVMPVDSARLARIPDLFRDQARLLASMAEGDPGRPRLEARLEDIEAQATRLREAWSELAAGPDAADEALEEIARTADELEALLEV